MGLLGGPGAREEILESYRPGTEWILYQLSKLGLDPYASYREKLRAAADAAIPGRATPQQYEALRSNLARVYMDPRGGGTQYAAGFSPTEQAELLRMLMTSGYGQYVRNPYDLSNYLQALGVAEEATGSRDLKQNIQYLNQLVGPLSYYSYNPNQIEYMVRQALAMRGEGNA